MVFSVLISIGYNAVFDYGYVGLLQFGKAYIFLDYVIATLFGVVISLILLLNIYSIQTRRKSAGKKGIAGALIGVIPSLTCCSPLLPSLLVFFGGAFPVLVGKSGFVQGLLATYELEIIFASLFIVLYGLLKSSTMLFACNCAARKPRKNA